MNTHKMTESEIADCGIDVAEYENEHEFYWIDFNDELGAWFTKIIAGRYAGKFWAIAFNVDKIFDTQEECVEWLREQLC